MTTIPAYYPPARWRPVSYIGEANRLLERRGWILHVVVGDGSPYGTFQGARSPHRRFSHLWVSKDGHIEQYQRLDRSSWAQAGGNPYWWSVETEGFEDEPLTGAQIRALAVWHNWCNAADALATSPEGRGIGTHKMGGVAWGNHECPGAIRAAQRADIIKLAQAIRSGKLEDDMELTDRIDIKGKDKNPITVAQATRGAYLQALDISQRITKLDAQITKLQRDLAAVLKALGK